MYRFHLYTIYTFSIAYCITFVTTAVVRICKKLNKTFILQLFRYRIKRSALRSGSAVEVALCDVNKLNIYTGLVPREISYIESVQIESTYTQSDVLNKSCSRSFQFIVFVSYYSSFVCSLRCDNLSRRCIDELFSCFATFELLLKQKGRQFK